MSYKYIIFLVLLLVSGGVGYYIGSGNVEIQERIITKEGEIRTQIVERTVTKTVVVQPDGTRTETETTTDITKDEESRTSESDSSTVVVYARPDYSLGVQFHQEYREIPNIYNEVQNFKNYNIEVGRRLLGPIWAEVSAGMNTYSVGIRMEF